MNTILILKATIITLLIPGAVVLLVPYFVFLQPVATDRFELALTAVLAAIVGLAGVVMLIHCIWGFALHGKGTLAPF